MEPLGNGRSSPKYPTNPAKPSGSNPSPSDNFLSNDPAARQKSVTTQSGSSTKNDFTTKLASVAKSPSAHNNPTAFSPPRKGDPRTASRKSETFEEHLQREVQEAEEFKKLTDEEVRVARAKYKAEMGHRSWVDSD